MPRLIWVIVCVLVYADIIQASETTAPSEKKWITIEKSLVEKSIKRQWITMRDGVRLDTNIFFPKAGNPPYPTILIRSPYAEHFIFDYYLAKDPAIRSFLESGYVIVYQHERGRYWSEGESVYLAQAKNDGFDTLSWLAKQPWSNGKIGTFGCSSLATNQLSLMTANHPSHKAAIVQGYGTGVGHIGPYWEQGFLRGGVAHLWGASWFRDIISYGKRGAKKRPTLSKDLSQQERQDVAKRYSLLPDIMPKPIDETSYYRHLPISDLNRAVGGPLTDWDDFISRSPSDLKWLDTDFVSEGDEFSVPALWLASWYDISVAPSIALYDYVLTKGAVGRGKGNQYLIISPETHCGFGNETKNTIVGARDVGDARYDYNQHFLQWFDYWLKDDQKKPTYPLVQYYQMGSEEWIKSNRFPQKGTKELSVYLDSMGKANSLFGDGILRFERAKTKRSDQFFYDPMFPVPTLGGGFSHDAANIGSFDQRPVEVRQDVLVYTSEPLSEPLRVSGFIKAELYLSSNVPDTDITLKLIDVYPDGRAYNLDDTIFRLRYREGYDKNVPMQEEEIYKVIIPPMITANTFNLGHRIRLEISSSNFPRYGRNLNTGGSNFNESKPVIASTKIHHSPITPSRLVLPIAPN